MRRLTHESEPALSAAPWATGRATLPERDDGPALSADYRPRGGFDDGERAPALLAEPREEPSAPERRVPALAPEPREEPAAPKRRAALAPEPRLAPRRAAATPKRGGSRLSRRALMWKKRLTIAGIAAAASALAVAAAIAIAADRPAQVWREARADVLDWTARNGLAVTDIQAIGRRNTSGEDILLALGVSARTPILGLDLVDAKRRVESLPWVASAEIERRLPHALRIVITERVPVAILQTADRSMLIDAKGVQIVPVAAQSGGLPIVTGRGAAENVADLLADLARFPEVASRVKAAVRVGDRRWDIKLDSVADGVEVRLPEIESAAAIGRLAELDRKHRLLERSVSLVDLRMPDRMVVRLTDGKTLPTPNFGLPQKGHSA